MLGRDLAGAEMAAWRQLARYLAERQRRLVQDAMDRVASRGLLPGAAPVNDRGNDTFLQASGALASMCSPIATLPRPPAGTTIG